MNETLAELFEQGGSGEHIEKDVPQLIDHDDSGLNQSKVMNVIDSHNLEREMQISLRNLRELDCAEKSVATFPHSAPGETTNRLPPVASKWQIGIGIAGCGAQAPHYGHPTWPIPNAHLKAWRPAGMRLCHAHEFRRIQAFSGKSPENQREGARSYFSQTRKALAY
jgi:hypothetical protein